MADNVLIDNGSEADFTAASDDVSGVQYPYVKLVDGTAESTAKIGGDATNGLDVDVTRVIPGTSATHLGKAEDAVHSSGDTGVMVLAVRQDTLAALAANGDYIPLSVDANGAAYTAVNSIPAAAVTTDNLGAAAMTNVVMNGVTSLTPKFKSLTVAASQTDASVVAAVGGKKLRVLSLAHQCAGTATTATYESDGGSDTRLHKVPAGANGGQVLGFSPVGHFETLTGEALIVTTGAGSDTEITLTYIEV